MKNGWCGKHAPRLCCCVGNKAQDKEAYNRHPIAHLATKPKHHDSTLAGQSEDRVYYRTPLHVQHESRICWRHPSDDSRVTSLRAHLEPLKTVHAANGCEWPLYTDPSHLSCRLLDHNSHSPMARHLYHRNPPLTNQQ